MTLNRLDVNNERRVIGLEEYLARGRKSELVPTPLQKGKHLTRIALAQDGNYELRRSVDLSAIFWRAFVLVGSALWVVWLVRFVARVAR